MGITDTDKAMAETEKLEKKELIELSAKKKASLQYHYFYHVAMDYNANIILRKKEL